MPEFRNPDVREPQRSNDVGPRAQRALECSPLHQLQVLRVEQTAAGLVISGSVPSFYFKQLAQEAVRTVARDIPIVNSVHVP